MKIDGYKIQHTIRELEHQREIAASQFADSLYAFPGETKPETWKFAEIHQHCEESIAGLQVVQARYNLAVLIDVPVDGGQGLLSMTLHEAVKRVGGAGRMEKMWRSASKEPKERFGYGGEHKREAGAVFSRRTVPLTTAIENARFAARFANALRAAIQKANATEKDMDVDEALFG